MTAATYDPVEQSTRPSPWQPLVWLVPLTALWALVTYSFPIVGASGVPTMVARLTVQIALVLGLWLGLERTDLSLMALPAAYLVAAGTREGHRAAVAWNIFGLVDFAIAISIGNAIAPGPLQLITPDIPNATIGAYPTVLIPAFAVPSSILLHALSLRQLARRAKMDA